jgi:glycosidase
MRRVRILGALLVLWCITAGGGAAGAERPAGMIVYDASPFYYYGDAAVRNCMLAACSHWLRDYHVDGFRLDAAWAIRQRDPRFWPRLGARLARIDPNIILIAEASGRDGYYVTHGFDAAYDWTSRLGQWAWDGVFAPAALALPPYGGVIVLPEVRSQRPARR